MPPYNRSQSSFRGRGRGRGRWRTRGSSRAAFATSRLHDVGDDLEKREDNVPESDREQTTDENDEITSDHESDTSPADTYHLLLSSLTADQIDDSRARKKRKVNGYEDQKSEPAVSTSANLPYNTSSLGQDLADSDGSLSEQERVAEEELESESETSSISEDEDEHNDLLREPFSSHYASEHDTTTQHLPTSTGSTFVTSKVTILETLPQVKRVSQFTDPSMETNVHDISNLRLKERLEKNTLKMLQGLSIDETNMAGIIFTYVDMVSGCRTVRNAPAMRDVACLHALNHVFKTRDRILKNNARLTQAANSDDLECRDQGFTRPKVLFILPTKQACVKYIDSIVSFSKPEQQENKARLMETYSQEDDETWDEKPEDFKELFGGNHDEDFRIGLKFTRKTIKFFSGFYNSDIIIGSPLGLMRTISTGGGKKGENTSENADFLSSIEVVIMDNTSALQMSNWQHVEYVFSKLNLQPKESHGCDFSRVRQWCLDGKSNSFRQNIIFSNYLTPEINSLVSHHSQNYAGRVKYTHIYQGAMLDVSSFLPFQVTQTFLRFDSPNPNSDSDARFKHFTTTTLPNLIRDSKASGTGVLLFVPTYFDFVRLRNHFSTATETISLSFGTVSEYTPVRDVARARSHFASGRHSLLLYSERAHHHFRYRIRGVKKIIFYGISENPVFWGETIGLLGISGGGGGGGSGVKKGDQDRAAGNKQGRGLVRALFSKWDVMKLERIVGSDRVKRLVSDKGGDVFEFV